MKNLMGACVVPVFLALGACSEETVTSAYIPKPSEIRVTLPDIDAAGQAIINQTPIILPHKKQFEINARIANFSRLTNEGKGRLEVTFRTASGTPRQSLPLERVSEQDHEVQLFRALVLALDRSGPYEIVIFASPGRVEVARFPAVVRELR